MYTYTVEASLACKAASMAEEALKSELVAKAQAKTEAYLPRIDKERASTLSATDLEGAVPYEKKYVGAYRAHVSVYAYGYKKRWFASDWAWECD